MGSYHIDMSVIWHEYWGHGMLHRSNWDPTKLMNQKLHYIHPSQHWIWWYLHNVVLDSTQMTTCHHMSTPEHQRGPTLVFEGAFSRKKMTFSSYILSFLVNHVKSEPCLKSTHSSSRILECAKYFDVIEDLSLQYTLGTPVCRYICCMLIINV